MIDEGTEKRWLFDTLRYNLQNEDDKSNLHSSSSNIYQQHHNANQSTLSDFVT